MKPSNISQNAEFLTGNCVVLEGEGDLDHYRCVEKFNRSCPSTPYYDEEIYKCKWSLCFKQKINIFPKMFLNFRFLFLNDKKDHCLTYTYITKPSI